MSDSKKKQALEAVKLANAFRWIWGLPSVAKWATLVTVFVAPIWAYVVGLPLWLSGCILIGVILTALIVATALRLWYMSRHRDIPYAINVDYTHNDGWNKHQAVTFTNNSEGKTFTADVQILRSNRPPNHPTGKFRLGWEDGSLDKIHIERGLSARLLISDFQEVIPHDMWTMNLKVLSAGISRDLWFARWEYSDPVLPRFHIRVTLMAEGAEFPWTRCFSVGPQDSTGPVTLQDMGNQ